jgi:N-acyl-D-amino-acid deacylase
MPRERWTRLEKRRRARADIYPYLAGSANLSQLLPGWVHEGGTQAMVQRLRDSTARDRIRAEWQSTLVQQWDEVLVCWVRAGGDTSVVGKYVSEIAAERNT